ELKTTPFLVAPLARKQLCSSGFSRSNNLMSFAQHGTNNYKGVLVVWLFKKKVSLAKNCDCSIIVPEYINRRKCIF
ncbi:MAG: hypothetical protein C0469_07995, partial [Cyanobacteria bacterium DS2.3.42]|nr:hypothetical protein [Cyanobacteria bacterium DS2.3.42]